MRILKYYICIIIFLCCTSVIFAQETENIGTLKSELDYHFANYFTISKNNVHIQLIHVPNKIPQKFSIRSKYGIRLGHQTLWLIEKVTGKKYAVTLEASIDIPIITAKRKIARRSEFNNKNVTLTVKQIHNDISQYITSFDELEGMMAVQMIRTGTGITQSMLRPRLDMNRGDDIIVQIVSGNIIIETKGIVKKEGKIGEDIPVVLIKTGKRISGEIISNNFVKIELN